MAQGTQSLTSFSVILFYDHTWPHRSPKFWLHVTFAQFRDGEPNDSGWPPCAHTFWLLVSTGAQRMDRRDPEWFVSQFNWRKSLRAWWMYVWLPGILKSCFFFQKKFFFFGIIKYWIKYIASVGEKLVGAVAFPLIIFCIWFNNYHPNNSVLNTSTTTTDPFQPTFTTDIFIMLNHTHTL